MFNSEGFEKLGMGIYIYKSFISKEKSKELLDLALSEQLWYGDHESSATTNRRHVKELEFLIDELSQKFSNGVVLDNYCYFQKYVKGQYMGPHRDDNKILKEIKESENYVDGMEYIEIKQPIYGLVLYLNNTNGGDLIYPNQNIIYHPSPGDLVIHEASDACIHMSTELVDGVKVVVPNYAYRVIRVPK